jgi:hypothetical protein
MFGGERDPRQVADERRWFAHDEPFAARLSSVIRPRA